MDEIWNITNSITKILSANDTGETGTHQAGTHIPKSPSILSFFPMLNKLHRNPRVPLHITDQEGETWHFSFIYYNNKFFGGTRNEYRLTGMTKYLRRYNLKAGDRLTLYRNDRNDYRIEYVRSREGPSDVLYLGNSWKVVRI
jgi:hypothetical protein